MEWFGFWIFMSVLVACDTWLFSQGYNSFLWTWKGEKELACEKLLSINKKMLRVQMNKKLKSLA